VTALDVATLLSAVAVALTAGTAVQPLPGVETVALQTLGAIQVPTVARAVTALVGFFVAYQAFRGYRRNDSRPMLFLGVGIAFVTTVSFVVSTLVVRPLGASEAVAVLSWTLSNVVGLAAIFYAFTGASRGGDRGRRRSESAADGGSQGAGGGPPGDAREAGGGRSGDARDATGSEPASDGPAGAAGGGDR
jgi:hypothetical protein